MAVGIGRTTAALLTVPIAVVLVVATLVPTTAACRPPVVAAVPKSAGEAEAELRCVHRCTTEMLACAAASGCASSGDTVWRLRLQDGGGSGAPCGGGRCESEYLGCIDVC